LPFKPGDSVSVKVGFTADKSFVDWSGLGMYDPSAPPTYVSHPEYGQWLELRVYAVDASSGEPEKDTPYLTRRSLDYRTVPPKGSLVERQFDAFQAPRLESGKSLLMKLWLVGEIPGAQWGAPKTRGYVSLGAARFLLRRGLYKRIAY
jgi:hypothetical protein